MAMTLSNLLTTVLGGFLVGFVFSGLRLPLPIPALSGLVAAAACLAGASYYQPIIALIMRTTSPN